MGKQVTLGRIRGAVARPRQTRSPKEPLVIHVTARAKSALHSSGSPCSLR